MATTKTLTPTNETITIDAFQGEKPDHRHVADAETKLADAVNALNSKIGNLKFFATSVASNGSKTLTIANDTRAIIYTVGGSQNVMDCISINSTSGGVVAYKSMNAPSGQTVSTSTNALTITNTNSVGTGIYVLIFTGSIS